VKCFWPHRNKQGPQRSTLHLELQQCRIFSLWHCCDVALYLFIFFSHYL
jgi:hypothetical protein